MAFAIPPVVDSALFTFVASSATLAVATILIVLGKVKRKPRLIGSTTAAIAVAGVSLTFWAIFRLPGMAYEVEQTAMEELLFAAALWFIVYYWMWLLYFGLSRLARLTRPAGQWKPADPGISYAPTYDRQWILSLLRNHIESKSSKTPIA